MPLRALLLAIEQPQGDTSHHLKQQPKQKEKHGSTLLSPTHAGSTSRPSSFRSSIAAILPNGDHRASRWTANPSTPQSSRVSLPQSDADPGPGARFSVHSPTPSILQTTSGTDYAASSPPLSPQVIPPLPVPYIRTPTPHSIRVAPEPEPPPELDARGRPILKIKTQFPAVGSALRYYRQAPESDEEEEEDPPQPKPEEEEPGSEKRSKLKTDWRANPHAKPHKRKEECIRNPLHAPTRATPPVRFGREEDEFAKWLNEDAFWAGKRLCKDELGWRKRTALEMAEILAKAEDKRLSKKPQRPLPVDGDQPHQIPFNEDDPLPMAPMTEITATHYRDPVACMRIGSNWQFPIPLAHLTHDQIVGLAKRGLLVVAVPPGHPEATYTVATLSTMVSTAIISGKDRDSQTLNVPAFAVIPASPVTPVNPRSPVAETHTIKEGFSSLFSRAKSAREQFLKPSSSPAPSTATASPSTSSTPLPSTPVTSSPSSPMTDISFSSSIPAPNSPLLSSPSLDTRKSIDTLSVLSTDTVASTSSTGSRKNQWLSWASNKWGR